MRASLCPLLVGSCLLLFLWGCQSYLSEMNRDEAVFHKGRGGRRRGQQPPSGRGWLGRRCWLIDVAGDGLTLDVFPSSTTTRNTSTPPALAIVTTPKNQQRAIFIRFRLIWMGYPCAVSSRYLSSMGRMLEKTAESFNYR